MADSLFDTDAPEGEKKVPDQGEKLDALFKELEAMKRQNQDLRKDVLRLSLIGPAEEDREPAIPEVDMSDLPDMYQDPEGFKQGYASRVAAAARANPGPQRRERNVDELWNQFRSSYPEVAANPEMVEVAVKKAMSKGEAKGYDMQRYMFGHPEMFFEDIIDEHNRIFGGAHSKAEGKEAPSEKGKKEEAAQEEAEMAWGIFGAYQPAGKAGAEAEGEALGSVSSDLKSLQRAAGISW